MECKYHDSLYTSDHYSNSHSREALRNSKPVPGGFHCALDKASADRLFHDITINGAIVWADDNGQ